MWGGTLRGEAKERRNGKELMTWGKTVKAECSERAPVGKGREEEERRS